MSETSCIVRPRLLASLRWEQDLPLEVVDVEPPPGGSFLDLPGPRRRPRRPYLEPVAGPGGLAARVLRGDAQAMPVALLIGEPATVLPLPEAPSALSMREDGGLWALHEESLAHYDAAGKRVHSLDADGMRLIGAPGDAVWIVGFETASFVAADGTMAAEYTWEAGVRTVGVNGAICAVDQGHRSARCLTPAGEERTMKMPAPLRPFEDVLRAAENQVVTLEGAALRRYRPEGDTDTIAVQSAGLTTAAEPFVSGRSNDHVDLCVGQDAARRLDLPSEAPTLGAVRVVTVEGTRSLVYGLDFAAWYDDNCLTRTFAVDEARFVEEIFPLAWELGPAQFATATTDGTVVLAASGPTGAILIALDWDSES